MDRSITVSGSMEMDNGWAVSSSYTIDGGLSQIQTLKLIWVQWVHLSTIKLMEL